MAQSKRTTRNRGTLALSGLTRPDDIARLRSLLELSCDCAWEQDAEHRFIRWSDHRETRSETGRVDAVVGKTLWDLGWTPVTGSWNEHHLLRRAQQPFRNLLLAVGQHPFERYLSFSGTPRFSRSGTFVGYHGICQQRAGGDVLGQLIRQEREVHRLREREAYYANMAFYRDWWAGRKFGVLAVRTGEAAALIASHEAKLAAAPRNAAAQLSLAYLYEATGNRQRSNEMWSMLER